MRRVILIISGVVVAALVAVALVVFQPWLLFTDVRVDETIPTVQSPAPENEDGGETAEATQPVQLAGGSFVSQEHTTSGTVSIIENSDGTRILAIENLNTTNGPDVHVWLSAADAVEGTDGWFLAGGADYVDLGPIKGNQGNQLYDIPADVDLSQFRSVSLWCVQFNVGFGAAQLTPV